MGCYRWALVCLVRLCEALCCEVQTTSRGIVAAELCGLAVRRAAIVDLQRQELRTRRCEDVKTRCGITVRLSVKGSKCRSSPLFRPGRLVA
jgi:hypothetical protein